MRGFLILGVCFFVLTVSCSTSNQTSDAFIAPKVTEGMHLIPDTPLPFDSSLTQSVAKVYKGNEFLGSGAFVSKNGLFLTNYSLALEHFSINLSGPGFSLSEGFIAQNNNDEILLPGISLLIEIEQIDVSQEFSNEISDSANNFEIFQTKQRVGQALIAQKKASMPDALVVINDIFSGNRQIMSVYIQLSDIRLVFAPALSIKEQQKPTSSEIYQSASGNTAIFRAYTSNSEGAPIPFNPKGYIEIVNSIAPEDYIPIALGFPNRTHRLESEYALDFYRTDTNPYILEAYESFVEKEDFLSQQFHEYSTASLARRFNSALQVDQYTKIQESFEKYDLLTEKLDQEQFFKEWLADSTQPNNYRSIYNFIQQAFEIAEQNGAGFYATSYIHLLSPFDEIGTIFRNHLDSEQSAGISSLVQQQYQLLSNINIEAESALFKDLILLLSKLPEEQQFLSIQDILSGVPKEDYEQAISEFMDRMRSTSFLLNPEKTEEVLTNNAAFEDSLYQVIDESLFLNEMSRNNQGIYVAYLQPARQVFVKAKMDFYGENELQADANGTIRYNKGSFNRISANGKYLFTNNDFSGRAPGSIVINQKGELLGIIGNAAAENLISNYIFIEEHAFVKSIHSQFVVDQIIHTSNNEALMQELGLEN